MHKRKYIVNATAYEVSSDFSNITADSDVLKGLSARDVISARWTTNGANAVPLTQDPDPIQDVVSCASQFLVLFVRNRS